ncbi:uncharacterized protein LOC143756660 [Siphateles boraxobius]|uniref:uncharacterized protein LOC143756660 n=1 Tax=Siphateles boraxobius TaxID=180520 RepID=UPI00406382E6
MGINIRIGLQRGATVLKAVSSVLPVDDKGKKNLATKRTRGSQTKGNNSSEDCETGQEGYNGDILIPVIVILCEALLLSIAVNVYFICMKRYREPCQNFYTNYIAVSCSCGTPNQPEQTDDQVQADTQYSAIRHFSENREHEGQSEESPIECVYSDVKHSGTETSS